MQFSYIIVSVFAALVSQGNIASALPQGQFESRSEYIGGETKLAALDARAPVIATEVEARDTELNTRTAHDVAGFIQDWATIGGAACGVTFVAYRACTTEEQREHIYDKLADCWAAIMVKAGNKKYKTAKQHAADKKAIASAVESHSAA